ncbi:MAG: hypothetical protein SGJ18_12130 [Pseudomonadota bacterium]|nr:hypothetical protein [Pseudomonadota bacterium]
MKRAKKSLVILLIIMISRSLNAQESCNNEDIQASFDTALDYVGYLICITPNIKENPGSSCVEKRLLLGALINGGLILDLGAKEAAEKLEVKEGFRAAKNKVKINSLSAEIPNLKAQVDEIDKLIVKALKDPNAIKITMAQEFNDIDPNKDSLKLRQTQKTYLKETIEQKARELKDLKFLQSKYNFKMFGYTKAVGLGRVMSAGGAAGVLIDSVPRSTTCPLKFSDTISDFDENCNPIIQLGESEIGFFKLSVEKRAEILKQYPQLCSHFADIAQNFQQKSQILGALYYSNNRIAGNRCNGRSVTYDLKGNDFIGDATLTSNYNAQKQITDMAIKTKYQGREKTYTLDYAQSEDGPVVNSLKWESTDPNDNWMGGRSVLRAQLDAARNNPSVEKAALYTLVHSGLGQKAVNCCLSSQDCDKISSENQKKSGRKKPNTR